MENANGIYSNTNNGTRMEFCPKGKKKPQWNKMENDEDDQWKTKNGMSTSNVRMMDSCGQNLTHSNRFSSVY